MANFISIFRIFVMFMAVYLIYMLYGEVLVIQLSLVVMEILVVQLVMNQ